MKKLLIFTILLFMVTSCGYTIKDTNYYPALPRETRGADYQPAGKIERTITYYRDADYFSFLVVPYWDIDYFIMNGGEKKEIDVVDGEEYDNYVYRVHNLEPFNDARMPETIELTPPVSYLLDLVIKENPDMSVILNPKITDTCEGDQYLVPLAVFNWIMADRQCELTIKGTKGILR